MGILVDRWMKVGVAFRLKVGLGLSFEGVFMGGVGLRVWKGLRVRMMEESVMGGKYVL